MFWVFAMCWNSVKCFTLLYESHTFGLFYNLHCNIISYYLFELIIFHFLWRIQNWVLLKLWITPALLVMFPLPTLCHRKETLKHMLIPMCILFSSCTRSWNCVSLWLELTSVTLRLTSLHLLGTLLFIIIFCL